MPTKVAVVTGANQGLGYALVEALCRVLGTEGVVYLTARDPDRGHAAAAALRDAGLSPGSTRSTSPFLQALPRWSRRCASGTGESTW